MSDAVKVFRILSRADVNLLVVYDRRADEVAARPLAAELVLAVLRVRVELPDQAAGLGFQSVEPTVAAREDDLALTLDDGVRRGGPLAVHDGLAGQVAFPDEFARVLVQANEARRLGEWNVDVILIHAIRSDDKQQIADD